MSRFSVIAACGNCPIRHNAICAECTDDEMAILEQAKSYRTVPAGSPIASAGEELTHLSSIVSGCATMSRTLEDGRRQTVGLLLPSDFIGRPGRPVSAFDIEATTEVLLCRFERRVFERMVRETPNLSARLLVMTLDELDAARDRAVVLGRMTAREKVASFLVSLARRQARGDGRPAPEGRVTLVLPLTRDAVSDFLGLTIETTSRQFTALRRDGLIESPSARDLRIPDFGRLVLASGHDDDDELFG